ncbi:hypothetical protein FMM68_12570 [Lachnospiraceae bacterium MD329]|nr:hypothetical protein [Lachnospiraceae bacterium MD329]
MENEKASYFEKTKITSAGLRLIHKLIMMGEPLSITKAVIGDGISEQDPVTITELVHEIPSRQTGQEGTSAIVDLQMYLPEDEQTISTRVRVQNGDTEFTLREIALIANDPDIGDIKFAYTRDNTENAMTFPVYDGVPISATVDISFFVHNAANVEMNVTLPAEVSLAEFNAHKNAAELDHPDKSVKKRHIADYAIGTMQLEKGAVNNVCIGNNAVDARTIKDGEVTEQKLSNSLATVIDVLERLAVDTRPKIPLCVLDNTDDTVQYYPGKQFLDFTHREGVQFGDLFIMWNSNDEDYDFLQANDENGYKLSQAIPAGHRAVCGLLKDYVPGADHRDGAIDVFIVKE